MTTDERSGGSEAGNDRAEGDRGAGSAAEVPPQFDDTGGELHVR